MYGTEQGKFFKVGIQLFIDPQGGSKPWNAKEELEC